MQNLLEKRQQLVREFATNTQEYNLDQVLKWTTDHVVEYFDAFFSRVWIIETNPQNGTDMLHLKASSGAYTRTKGSSREWAAIDEAYKLGKIVVSKAGHFTNQVQLDPEIKDHSWARKERLVAFAGYPLMMGSECAGVLIAYSQKEITDQEYKILDAFVAALGTRLMRFDLKTVR